MSIGTYAFRSNEDRISGSQLPFGFDVDWDTFYKEWSDVILKRSQLPFGFDVDWDRISTTPRGWLSSGRLNCLSALMSIGTREGLDKMAVLIKSQLPFGFDVDWDNHINRWLKSGKIGSQLPFGFDVDWDLPR